MPQKTRKTNRQIEIECLWNILHNYREQQAAGHRVSPRKVKAAQAQIDYLLAPGVKHGG